MNAAEAHVVELLRERDDLAQQLARAQQRRSGLYLAEQPSMTAIIERALREVAARKELPLIACNVEALSEVIATALRVDGLEIYNGGPSTS